MADKEEEEKDEGLDENGLVIHEYASTVLVVMPSKEYDETTLRYARSALYNVHVHTHSVSTETDELIEGVLQDEFQVDKALDESVRMDEYSGVLFCGGPGSVELAQNDAALRLAREAASAGKLIGAWGESVEVLARAGVLQKRKVTGAPRLESAVKSAGGRYQKAQVVRDENIVTAVDDAASFRFGKLLVQVVAI